MLTLVELLQQLTALATGDAPDKLERIAELFANPRAPAEFQIGRHYVSRLLAPEIERRLDSIEPADRKLAIVAARRVLSRGAAMRALRRVYNDPNSSVRGTARRASLALGAGSLAARATLQRAEDPQRPGDMHRLWAFGIFARDRARPGRPVQPTRPTAIAQHGLPPLADADAVAQLLGVDELAPLMRPGSEPGSSYIEFEIPKAKGGTRRIAAPRAPLRAAQRTILERILARVPLHDACHGFVAGRSTVTNARPHARAAIVVKLDLKDFFPTVHYRRVQGIFRSLGYNDAVASALAALTTYRPKLANGEVAWPGTLPQGAPTSPALANLACRRLDHRLSRLAATYGAVYTRYADDLTFSFATVPALRIGRFLWWVDAICQHEGFHERPDKRRILRRKHQQRVTGLVVNDVVHVPRADRKRFRAILHNCARHGVPSQARGRGDFAAYLAGYAAYVSMVDPVLGKTWVDEVARLLGEAPG